MGAGCRPIILLLFLLKWTLITFYIFSRPTSKIYLRQVYGVLFVPALAQNPVRHVCHCSDWLPAHCLLICLSFPDQSHSGPELLQHKQAHWFPHTNCPRSTVTGLSFRLPSSAFRHLSLLRSPPTSPSGRKDLGHMPGAGRQSASHLEEVLHFSPLTQKNMVLRKLVFSTENSQRKKSEKEEPAAPHSGLTTSPCPFGLLRLEGIAHGQAAELQLLLLHTV